jgi:hypothetical protein
MSKSTTYSVLGYQYVNVPLQSHFEVVSLLIKQALNCSIQNRFLCMKLFPVAYILTDARLSPFLSLMLSLSLSLSIFFYRGRGLF